jgi:peptidoglycan L-alanyl-D-glutamate endopeptidase CwlK
MPKFGRRSKAELLTCVQELQNLFNEVVKRYDCAVLCGTRGEEEQNKAYREGRSTKQYPDSKHNLYPSVAVDVVPYFTEKPHIRWEDRDKFYHFAGYVQAVADRMNINLRWGGNWDMDDELHDQTLFDLPHFEIL